MSQNNKSNAFVEIVHHARMVFELLRHPNVNILIKAIPLLALIYWIVPTDLIPIIPVVSATDDLVVIGIALSLFYFLVPKQVMEEVDARLHGNNANRPSSDQDTIIDGYFVEVDENDGVN